MHRTPETRVSLILRLAQPDDVAAWHEFAEIYTPMLLAAAARKGIQPADCEDVAQEILFSVARSVERFKPDRERAKFRTWLWRIARCRIADFIENGSRQPHQNSGQTELAVTLAADDQAAVIHDVQVGLFRVASEAIRRRVAPTTWQAFEMTAIEGQSVQAAASATKLSVGSVYVARCRVLKLIRDETARLGELDDAPGVAAESSSVLSPEFWKPPESSRRVHASETDGGRNHG
ncbi:MAG TPA: sigma-70 family RNA polymerase sigma factor [Planctomycetaceae bacterium]|nr:sigma-70 family RNA polymerase sigma factor [Planctomycetaceae bacterium]